MGFVTQFFAISSQFDKKILLTKMSQACLEIPAFPAGCARQSLLQCSMAPSCIWLLASLRRWVLWWVPLYGLNGYERSQT
jgi:hypothetical protein